MSIDIKRVSRDAIQPDQMFQQSVPERTNSFVGKQWPQRMDAQPIGPDVLFTTDV